MNSRGAHDNFNFLRFFQSAVKLNCCVIDVSTCMQKVWPQPKSNHTAIRSTPNLGRCSLHLYILNARKCLNSCDEEASHITYSCACVWERKHVQSFGGET